MAEDPFREKGAAFVAETGSYYDKEQSNFQALQTDLIGRREKEPGPLRLFNCGESSIEVNRTCLYACKESLSLG